MDKPSDEGPLKVSNISADGTTVSIIAKSMGLNAVPWSLNQRRQKAKNKEEPEAVLIAIVASSLGLVVVVTNARHWVR